MASPPPQMEPPPCSGSAQPICEALRIRDHHQRLTEARRAFEAALVSKDPDAILDVAWTVEGLKKEVDFRPFADLFAAHCKQNPKECFWTGYDEDRALLLHGSRKERLDLLEAAIRTGSVKLLHGLDVERPWAVRLAATGGLAELRPLSEEYLALLSEDRKKRHALIVIGDLFDLCGGAATPREAPRLAIKRLHAMRDVELARREADPMFQKETLELVKRACWPDPWPDPLTRTLVPECRLLGDIVRRQRQLRAGSDEKVSVFDPCGESCCEDWLTALECFSRAANEVSVPAARSTVLVRPLVHTPGEVRRPGLDLCSIPELPPRQRWTQGTSGLVFVLSDLRAGPPGEPVDVSIGLLHHRIGDRVRLRVDVMDRQGQTPDWPVAIEISVVGNRGGNLYRVGAGSSCQRLYLLWNEIPENGHRIRAQQEFEFVLGSDAGVAGLIPSGDPARPLTPWWHEAARLHIAVGRIRDAGDVINIEQELDYVVRTEGPSVPAVNPLIGIARKLREGGRSAAILDMELEEQGMVVGQPCRAFVAVVKPEQGQTPRRMVCEARDYPERKVTAKITVDLTPVPGMALLLGVFTLIPGGLPDPGAIPGRYIFQPALAVAGGPSTTECSVVDTSR